MAKLWNNKTVSKLNYVTKILWFFFYLNDKTKWYLFFIISKLKSKTKCEVTKLVNYSIVILQNLEITKFLNKTKIVKLNNFEIGKLWNFKNVK